MMGTLCDKHVHLEQHVDGMKFEFNREEERKIFWKQLRGHNWAFFPIGHSVLLTSIQTSLS